MKKISFIHTADLHLDSPFVGLKKLPSKIFEKIRASTFEALSRIVDIAIDKRVDFVIIAGDIYDGEDRSIRAQIYFKNEMIRLANEGIPAYIVHGNHDHLGGTWLDINLPESVHIFPGTVDMVPYRTNTGSTVHLYGFSYPKKHVFEKVIDQYKKTDGADFHIGILHGHDSQNQSHYSYAPFNIKDLLEKGYQYWALGHIHKPAVLHAEPYVIYPGNPQGRHKNEDGERGCYFIEMNSYKTDLQFIPTAPILWKNLVINGEQILQTFEELLDEVIKLRENAREKGKSVFLDIVINSSKFAPELIPWLDSEEFLQILQEGEEEKKDFVWIYQVRLNKKASVELEKVNESFFGELRTTVQEVKDLQEPLVQLFQHSKTRRYLSELTPEEQAEIKQQAENLLVEYLKQ